ncbi:hypothetical protein BBJ28_00015847 [Nothophytophthora sp. Chile5]|nr:hypothetical protein BBJ28_00015847 [Nothophytophthora sp. Chile5]
MSLIRQSLRALKAVNTPSVARPVVARFSSAAAPAASDDDVVVPVVHQTLEWCLSSPPPLHQFEEAPLVIETYGDVDPYAH